MRSGTNRIEVRLSESDNGTPNQWMGRLAVDGGAILDQTDYPLPGPDGWRVCSLPSGDWQLPATPGPVRRASLPRLQYRGGARSDAHAMLDVTRCQVASVAAVISCLSILLLTVYLLTGRDQRMVTDVARMLFAAVSSATAVLMGGLLLRCGIAERLEVLWFLQPVAWSKLVAIAASTALVAGWWDLHGRTASNAHPTPRWSLRRLPKTAYWPLLLGVVLVGAFWVRAYRVDFQPLDDDEYASTQAILAIAKTGIPEFAADGVWYTRSPLFHYSMGVLTWMLGANLWVLRLPSVLLGVATCWLTYCMGSRLLKSPWVGLAAMVLLAIHPFQIFTAHVVRFYQMQQFLALLTVYWFCRGFVTGQENRYRYLTIVGFLCTVLSQEASCIMGFSLLLGYLLFAEEKSWPANVRLLIAASCALLLIAVDYFVFQARCMTRLAGILAKLGGQSGAPFLAPLQLLNAVRWLFQIAHGCQLFLGTRFAAGLS